MVHLIFLGENGEGTMKWHNVNYVIIASHQHRLSHYNIYTSKRTPVLIVKCQILVKNQIYPQFNLAY
jgi:hypothetical protein